MCFGADAGLTGSTTGHIPKYQRAPHKGMHAWPWLTSFGAILHRQCAADGQLYIPISYRAVGIRLAAAALLVAFTVSALSMEDAAGPSYAGHESEAFAFTWPPQYAHADMVPVAHAPHAGIFAGDVHMGYAGSISKGGMPSLKGAFDIASFESDGRTYAIVTSHIDNSVQILDITHPYGIITLGSITDDDSLRLSGALSVATFVVDGRTYAVVAEYYGGIQILDLTDPYNVIAAGSLADDDILSLSEPFGIMTFQSAGRTYAAVTAYNDNGVQMLDITDPYNVVPAGSLADGDDTLLDGAMGIAAFQSAGRTYAAVTAYNDNGVQILDIGDPYNVIPAGSLADDDILSMSKPFGVMTFQSAGRTYAAVAAYNDDGVQILDITDPYNIVSAGGADDATLRLRHPIDVAVYGMADRTYAAVLSDDQWGNLQILDLTDPYTITAAGTIPNGSGRLIFLTDLAVFESGSRTFAAAVTPFGGVQAFDITDPYDIIPAGMADNTEEALISSANDIAVFGADGNIYAAVTSQNQGVQVLDMSDPYNITLAGQITHEASHILYSAETIDIFESGDRTYAAVAGFNGGVQILDLSDPYNITLAGIMEDDETLSLDRAWDISVFETGGRTYALVASSYDTRSFRPPDYDDGVQVLDLTDPYNIVPAGGITDNAAPILAGVHDAAIFGYSGRTFAAVTSHYEDGVQVLDLTDPYNIVPAGSIDGDMVPFLHGGSSIDIFGSDGSTYAVVASMGANSVWAFDLADTRNIIPADVIIDDVKPVMAGARGLAVFESDGSTYVTVTSDEGIQVLDLADTYNIAAADSLLYNHMLRPGGAHGVDMFVSKDRTYAVAAFPDTDTLIVLDATDPYGIVVSGHIADDDQLLLSGVVAVTTFVYGESTYAVAASFEGVQMLDLTDPHNMVPAGGIGADTSPLLGGARDVVIFEMGDRTYAGVVSFNNIVCVIDLADPHNITLASSLIHHTGAGQGGASGIAVFESDGRTYAAVTSLGDNGVQILDLTNPYGMVPAGSISDDSRLLLSGAFGIDVFESDGRTYATVTSQDGVQVLDLTDPHNIVPVQAVADQIFRPLSDARDVAIFQSGGHTYAAVASYADGGVQILQISAGDGSGR